ncbi:MAG: arginine--tRNA ligase [Candidatus Pacebacteria bacterium]|nr:arginine--tRNA ligase [Candidatus Paceibacterota bacterium]MCF7862645.1 arginine--tRNA ligase [Candidatus Paceibacterota bacterium]
MNIKRAIEDLIKSTLRDLGVNEEVSFNIEHPEDHTNGDYSSNVAMVFAKSLQKNPKDFALSIVEVLKEKIKENEHTQKIFLDVKTAGAGFINFYLSPDFFHKSIQDILEEKDFGKNDLFAGKKVMIEYTQPNPFKPFHVGHLMSNTIGESLSRVIEYSGANMIRANYQGDVGLHVAKAIYGIFDKGEPDKSLPVSSQAQHIGECYSYASNLYDTDENIKKEIDVINKKVYERSDEKINNIYDWGREVTLEAFEEIYKKLGTKFDYYFFESEMAPKGEKIVRENIGKVFEESEGAIVFKAEKYDSKLHTRVFITKALLPTYETKEIALTTTKFEKENPDLSIVITAIEQADYMKVVEKAIEQMYPDWASRMKHVTHGMMRLASGKMSSRKGNVITGESLMQDSFSAIMDILKDKEMSQEEKDKIASVVSVSALKYSVLKQSLNGDIIFDFDKSISFDGDSGPYLQYSFARASSLLRKVNGELIQGNLSNEISTLERILYRFGEVVERSAEELAPNHIASYLIEVARAFNVYYSENKIIDTEEGTSEYRVNLVKAFTLVMQKGLYLLGVEAPEKM